MVVSQKILKSLAILDIIIDLLLIISLWVFVSNNHKLKVENNILKNEVVDQENQIIDKDNYIDYLETVIVESKILDE